tara:strand:- start:228 stop:776 length:549 start_codon:yes stop_codon:yes gene_type:complete
MTDCYIGLPHYDYNPDIYKYGDIFGERVRLNMSNHNDIYRWKSYKCRDDCWFKTKITTKIGKLGYVSHTIRAGKKTAVIMSRVVYKLYNPEWDITDSSRTNLIDHRNKISTDNRIENLRNLTNRENQYNRDVVGCSYDKINRNWTTRIKVNGKNISVCGYKTKALASEKYLELKKIHHILPE